MMQLRSRSRHFNSLTPIVEGSGITLEPLSIKGVESYIATAFGPLPYACQRQNFKHRTFMFEFGILCIYKLLDTQGGTHKMTIQALDNLKCPPPPPLHNACMKHGIGHRMSTPTLNAHFSPTYSLIQKCLQKEYLTSLIQ
jgi:hypothetical protein